jgi:Family of unknown function (DUF5675)
MELILKSVALNETYTIGKLSINGTYFCDTLEDKRIDLNKNGIFDGNEKKVYGMTAIPYGEYTVDMTTVSPRFSKVKQYDFCNGKLPRLVGVKEFDGVLIHIGNTPKDTHGCILVGKNTIKGQLTDSTKMFKALYAILLEAHNKGEVIKIKIT